jgi:hypothetical protein
MPVRKRLRDEEVEDMAARFVPLADEVEALRCRVFGDSHAGTYKWWQDEAQLFGYVERLCGDEGSYGDARNANTDVYDLRKLLAMVREDKKKCTDLLRRLSELDIESVNVTTSEYPLWMFEISHARPGYYNLPFSTLNNGPHTFDSLVELGSCCGDLHELHIFIHAVVNDLEVRINTQEVILNSGSATVDERRRYHTIFFTTDSMVNVDGQEVKLNDMQLLLMYLYNMLKLSGYRRYGDKCYEMVRVNNHTRTLAYRPVCRISYFVETECNRESSAAHWQKLTKTRGIKDEIVKHLSTVEDFQFPDIAPDRHIFSFTNGLLVTKEPFVTGRTAPRFIPYDSLPPEFENLTSSKYFDLVFDRSWICPDIMESDGPMGHLPQAIMDIPTPHLDKILMDQDMDEDTRAFVYCFMGRMIFEVGEHDNWQCMCYFMGAAGTGKSTLIGDVVIKFYGSDQVYSMGNNIERKFGMMNALNEQEKLKLLIAMPEVKHDLQLEQAEWQQMVSGENVTINRKNKSSVTLKFSSPMIAAGNEMVGFTDNGGSMSRRMIIFRFPNKIGERMDGTLPAKLEQEMAAILAKCSQAYVAMAMRFGDDNIWRHAAPSMKEERKQLEQSSNPLQSFLHAPSHTKISPELYCPESDFCDKLKNYMTSLGLGRLRWTREFYDSIFREHRLKIEQGEKEYNGGVMSTTWIVGVDLYVDGTLPSVAE